MFPDPLDATRSLADGAFDQQIDVKHASNVAAFEFLLHFDPAILQVESVSIGDFLSVPGCSVLPVEPVIDNSAGTVKYGAASYGSCGASGQGTLAHIRFQPIATGASPLRLTGTEWGDPLGNGLPHFTSDGQVTIIQ